MRARAVGMVISVLMAVAVPVLAAELSPGGSFVDDDGSIYEGAIEAMAAEGITKGCNPPFNDLFCPDSSVTRGQMAAFLHRALGGMLTEGTPLDFVDTATSEFEADIAWLSAVGITKGCNPPDNDRFCPDSKVTREQMAAFLVRALGYTDPGSKDFVDDDDSMFESEIEKLATAGVTKGCNPPDNDRFCPTSKVTRGQMAAFLHRALGLPAPSPPDRTPPELHLVDTFAQPVHVTAPVGDDRLFIVEKGGVIRVHDGLSTAPEPFLDLSPMVTNSGERGLLSMAFHPDYEANGLFYVYYSGELRPAGPAGWSHTSYVVEYEVSADPDVADTGSRRVVMEVDQHYANHNGGHLLFGPDGMLYVSLGDGGGGGDPDENGQDIDTLWGSILRIDPVGAPYTIPSDNPFVGQPGRDEIWMYGVRNPWRIWFDEGLLYVADVGQGAREEVTVVADSEGGLNLGWDTTEGTRCFEPSAGCSTAGIRLPSLEYTHSEGCSITGGVVYRGSVKELDRWYLYSDLCGGWIRAARFVGSTLVDERDVTGLLDPPGGAWSFGVDGSGEVYVVYGGSGAVYRISDSG